MKKILFILLLVCIGSALFGMGEAPEGAGIGKKAPDFKLQDLKGIERALSDYKGKVVFLNFWATYCPPCVAEMPSMQALHDKLKGSAFVILAIGLDRSKKTILDFINEKKYTFAVLVDPDKKAANIYRVTGIPVTFIIDKNGIILHKTIGQEDWTKEEILKKLESFIK